jgi:hypothetical protein
MSSFAHLLASDAAVPPDAATLEKSVADGDNRYTQCDATKPDLRYHHFREPPTGRAARLRGQLTAKDALSAKEFAGLTHKVRRTRRKAMKIYRR